MKRRRDIFALILIVAVVWVSMGCSDSPRIAEVKSKQPAIGLFLLEEVKLVDLEVLHFFTCMAPKDSFPQYEDTFKAILASVSL